MKFNCLLSAQLGRTPSIGLTFLVITQVIVIDISTSYSIPKNSHDKNSDTVASHSTKHQTSSKLEHDVDGSRRPNEAAAHRQASSHQTLLGTDGSSASSVGRSQASSQHSSLLFEQRFEEFPLMLEEKFYPQPGQLRSDLSQTQLLSLDGSPVETVVFQEAPSPKLHRYHNNTELIEALHLLRKRFPRKTHLYNIGRSVNGVPLTVIAIAGSHPERHIPGRPEVKLVGNIHGDEVIGRELLLYLAQYLLGPPKRDGAVDEIMSSMRVHLLPSMNPDGFAASKEGNCNSNFRGRGNANSQDLNRNFPDPELNYNTEIKNLEIETQVMIKWMTQYPFILSGSFHGGALVANYPFDSFRGTQESSFHKRSFHGGALVANYPFDSFRGTKESLSHKRTRDLKLTDSNFGEYSATPDDDVFIHLARSYADPHPDMRKGCQEDLTHWESFTDGITNGHAWYSIAGGMQDYNYLYAGCLELTLEVSCCKYPRAEELPKYWMRNRKSLLNYLEQANKGVRGYIVDENGRGLRSLLSIKHREGAAFRSTGLGEFWRILLPGSYELLIKPQGFNAPIEVPIFIPQTSPIANYNITIYTDSRRRATGPRDDLSQSYNVTTRYAQNRVLVTVYWPYVVEQEPESRTEEPIAKTPAVHRTNVIDHKTNTKTTAGNRDKDDNQRKDESEFNGNKANTVIKTHKTHVGPPKAIFPSSHISERLLVPETYAFDLDITVEAPSAKGGIGFPMGISYSKDSVRSNVKLPKIGPVEENDNTKLDKYVGNDDKNEHGNKHNGNNVVNNQGNGNARLVNKNNSLDIRDTSSNGNFNLPARPNFNRKVHEIRKDNKQEILRPTHVDMSFHIDLYQPQIPTPPTRAPNRNLIPTRHISNSRNDTRTTKNNYEAWSSYHKNQNRASPRQNNGNDGQRVTSRRPPIFKLTATVKQRYHQRVTSPTPFASYNNRNNKDNGSGRWLPTTPTPLPATRNQDKVPGLRASKPPYSKETHSLLPRPHGSKNDQRNGVTTAPPLFKIGDSKTSTERHITPSLRKKTSEDASNNHDMERIPFQPTINRPDDSFSIDLKEGGDKHSSHHLSQRTIYSGSESINSKERVVVTSTLSATTSSSSTTTTAIITTTFEPVRVLSWERQTPTTTTRRSYYQPATLPYSPASPNIEPEVGVKGVTSLGDRPLAGFGLVWCLAIQVTIFVFRIR